LTRYGTWREVNVYYLSVKSSVKLGVNFSVMFHSTNGNDFCSETGSSTASLLCGSTVGYPSDSLASCFCSRTHRLARIHNVTDDRQTDDGRNTAPLVRSAKNVQKLRSTVLIIIL